MDYRNLAYLGLNDKEAKVYLATLQLGQSTVQKIATRADVNRATTYIIIESLIKKGLMSSVLKDKKQYYMAEAPEKLSLLFREEAMAIQRKQEYLEKILPNLKSLNGAVKNKPVVRYYEGKAGLKTMVEEFFVADHHKEPAQMIYSVDLLNDIFTEEEKGLMSAGRRKKGIKVKTIVNDKRKRLKSDSENYTIDAKQYPITSDVAFFGNKTRIATQKGELVGLIIDNKEITQTFKTLFDLAFKFLQNKKRGLKR